MIFVSYYTKNTPYENIMMTHLKKSLDEFKLPYVISSIDDRGSWAKNTAYKSTFIKDMLLKYKQMICFLDADAKIIRFPKLLFELPQDIDLAYHHFNWYKHWRNEENNVSKIELLSGTMLWNYNDKVLKLLDTWIQKVNENVNKWEQKVLEEIVYARNDLNIYNLPAEYCCVLMQDYSVPKYIKTPIIVHCQASRKYKRWHHNKEKNNS